VTASILAGPYRSVRIEPLLLAQDVRLRRWAKEQGKGQYEAIGLMALLWSWQAGRWRADGPWGASLPIAAVDALMGEGSSEAMVRVGLARWDMTRPSPAVEVVALRGEPSAWEKRRRATR
jgi:hypothetical protein